MERRSAPSHASMQVVEYVGGQISNLHSGAVSVTSKGRCDAEVVRPFICLVGVRSAGVDEQLRSTAEARPEVMRE